MPWRVPLLGTGGWWMGRAVDSKGTSMNIRIFEGKTGKSSRIGCESQAKLVFRHSRPEMSDVLLFCRDQTYLDMNKSFNLGVPTSIHQSPSISEGGWVLPRKTLVAAFGASASKMDRLWTIWRTSDGTRERNRRPLAAKRLLIKTADFPVVFFYVWWEVCYEHLGASNSGVNAGDPFISQLTNPCTVIQYMSFFFKNVFNIF